jgi:hypothetical protein
VDNGVDLLDRLDKWRNTATVRRSNLLKIIEYYGPVPDDNASIPEAEFKKVDQSRRLQMRHSALDGQHGKISKINRNRQIEALNRRPCPRSHCTIGEIAVEKNL